MNGLLRKLEKIRNECDVKDGKSKENEEGLDEFTRLKRKIASDLKGIL